MKKLLKLSLIITAILLAVPKTYAQLSIGISISANIAPPALPVYIQPACPTDGYLWVPGYWAWDNNVGDYYWVPGVWVAPPNPGLLWTPAYWGYAGGSYGFHAGYWGPHVGFYGGINYGGGYLGIGFAGGAWSGNSFRYNTAVVNVNRTVVHNTYIDRTVIVNNTIVNNHNSFNGPGGVTAKPRPEEEAAMKEQHVQPTSQQVSHEQTAHNDKSQFAKANHGKPATVAMNKPGGTHFNPQGKKAAPRAANTGAANKPAPRAVKPTDNKPVADHSARLNKPMAVKQQPKQQQPKQQQPKQQHAARAPQQHKPAQHKAAPAQHPQKPEEKR